MSVNNISVKPINDLSSTPSLQDTDNLLAQTSNGFKKVPISQLKEEVSVDTSTFAPTTMLKDTVGWTGKNLLNNTASTRTINGVTFTVNADKSVTVNGTATAEARINFNFYKTIGMILSGESYTLSGGPDGSSTSGYILYANVHRKSDLGFVANMNDLGKGVTRIISEEQYIASVVIKINSGITVNNITFYPMLRRADIADDTYEPFHESVEEVVESKLDDDYANLYGAKNLIPYPYDETSMKRGGITWTDNGDGTVTANGTSTNSWFNLRSTADKFHVKKGKYIFTSGLSNPSLSTYFAQITNLNGNNYVDKGGGVEIIVNEDTEIGANLIVVNGQTVENLTFSPMLRLASIKDDTWVPYAKTNKELTEETAEIKDKITTVKASYDEDTALYAHAVGDIVYVNEHFYKVTAAIAVGNTIATGTNITADIGLAVDTPIFVSNLPNS